MRQQMAARIFRRYRVVGFMLGAVALATAACGPPAPLYPEVAATIPPPAADRARIYFYREYEPYESLARPELYLNGTPAGASVSGGVFYRDVAPGAYDISVYSVGAIANADKQVALKPGDTVYAKVESLHSWFGATGDGGGADPDTFVVVLVDPARAASELARMRYVRADGTAQLTEPGPHVS
jgi:Protein of unknown function (DUF2846)